MRFFILAFVGVFLSLHAVIAHSVSIGAIADGGSGSVIITTDEISKTLSSDYRLIVASDSGMCMSGTWQAFFSSQGERFRGFFNGVVDGVTIFQGSTASDERPEVKVDFKNGCDYRIRVTVSVVSRTDSSAILARKDESIPAATYCAVDASDIELGMLTRGMTTPSSFRVTKTGSGISNILITGTDLDTSGIVHLGAGKAGVIIRPNEDKYIKGASWVLNGTDDTIPLTVMISASATPGRHSSILMLKLNCN